MKVKDCFRVINVANDVTKKLYEYKKGEINKLDKQTIIEATSLIHEYITILSSLSVDIDIEE